MAMRVPRIVGIALALAATAVIATVFPAAAHATTFYVGDFEAKTCDTQIADAEIVDGKMWDTYSGTYPVFPPQPIVRCAAGTPSGVNSVEWVTFDSQIDASVGIDFVPQVVVSMGTTYYLAGFFRFDRIGGRDIWHDSGVQPYSFDKLLEFGSIGTRWGIGAGWNGNYSVGVDHEFVFDAWCDDGTFDDCTTVGGGDHKTANQNGYDATHPPVVDYERWHAVVLGVLAHSSSSGTGNVKLWVNGVLIMDRDQSTMASSATITRLWISGTIAQPAYDSPAHYRRMDKLILTDNWQDIVNGGYLKSFSGDTLAPAAPTNLAVQ
jgi:hypothetical protein